MPTISRQLNQIVIASTGVVLAMLTLTLLVAEIVKFQFDVTHHISPIADTLGISLKQSLAIRDSIQAREILSTVSSDTFVEAVYLFDQYDHPFAYFERPRPFSRAFSGDRPEDLLEKGRILEVLGRDRQEVIFAWRHLLLFWPVIDGEMKLGTLYLVVNLVPLYERFLWWLLAALPLILLSALIGLWLARRLQRRISDPIAELARTMGNVSANHDFSVRVDMRGVDEISALSSGFNTMLEQIGARDRRLEEANLLLEQRVVERTVELQMEIEERRRAEQELRLFSDAMAQSFDGINITDLKGNILYCNEAVARIYGFHREELVGSSVERFNVDPEQTRSEIIPAIHARGCWSGEVRQRRQDGSEFPAALSASVVLDAEEQPIAMLGIVRDVSDAKRSEENLRILEKALATTNVGITITDLEGRLLYLNPAEARMHGYGVEELLGRHANVLAPSHLRREASPIRAGSWMRQSENQDKDGRTFPVQLTSDLVTDADGRPLAVVTVCEDITERLQAEERVQRERDLLETVTRDMGAGVTIISPDYRVVWSNNVIAQIFGPTEGKVCHQTFNHQSEICAGCGVREIFEGGRGRVVHEQVGTDQHGETIWSEIIATPIRDEEGKVVAAVELVVPITERKRAEQALRESEEKLQAILDFSPVAIACATTSGEIEYINRKFADMFGYAHAEIPTEEAWFSRAYPDPAYRQGVVPPWQASVLKARHEGGTIPAVEVDVTCKDGSVRHVLAASAMITDRLLVIMSDLTDRMEAEKALRDSEAKFRSLFEDSPVSLWEEDFSAVKECFERLRAEGVTDFAAYFAAHPETVRECASRVRIVAVNRATYTMFGAATREEFFDGLGAIFGEDSYVQFTAELVSLASGDTSFECEGINHTIVGEPLYVHLRLSVFPGSEERLDRVIVSLVDLTERRHMEEALRLSEERFRQMVDLLPQPVFECDARGRLLFSNRAGFNTFGHSPETLTAGLSVLDMVAPQEREAALPNLGRVLAGETIGAVERQMLCRDGHTFPALIHVAPILRDGRPAGMRGLIVDISTRKQIEERLLVSLREQEVLLREVHHRVKNNLQIISSLINLQLSKVGGEEVRAQLGTVRDRVRSMSLIHEQLYRSPVLARVNFALYAEEFARHMCRLYGIDPAQIELKLQVEPVQLDVELAIPCGLIVNELLTNAFKYAFPGGRRGVVTVGLEVAGERYRLFVADDGIGLPDDAPGGGATLGLQLVRSLAGQLGGEMSIERGPETRIVVSFTAAVSRR